MSGGGLQPLARRKVYLTIKITDDQIACYYVPARSFNVAGYEWQIDYNTDAYHHQERWVKLRLTLLRGPCSSATASFTFRFVDVEPSCRTPADDLLPADQVTERSLFRKGVPKEVPLAARNALEMAGYPGRDGNCFVQCEFVLDNNEPDTTAADARPLRDQLVNELGGLLSSQNGADVTFVVGAESFRAHRAVLAARSPVLAAELAGSLLDETHEVSVEDVDPDVFRALLHFIYTAALPPQLEQMDRRRLEMIGTEEDQAAARSMARRLLDAADQYGVEGLKITCEKKLCAGVGVGTVAADLVLAERRGYTKLKATCMEFLVADPANVLAVARAGGCKLLETSCPSVLTEIITALAARNCNVGAMEVYRAPPSS